eukprot:CAMPEP_0194265220 /NCGR_PEP_ID=MMETSP0169-20130528/537_1 /TAXON_ID=218684 /ORGANISM="Corethron pennatum, Strain L29A3" /LENGTH=151 /DNA_ID=CAMNT_0039005645 /DNA_START=95 /DNA_END=550 /DNA_ORIENTATION=-
MVKAPDALVWEIVGHNNCFLRKKSGNTRRTGTVAFSTEPGNLPSLSSFKYSGLASSQAVDVTPGETGAVLTLRNAAKVGAHPNKATATVPLTKCFRKSVKTISATAGSPYYRPDLKQAALAKYDAVYRSNRIARGVKKAVKSKQGRGNPNA